MILQEDFCGRNPVIRDCKRGRIKQKLIRKFCKTLEGNILLIN
jgi:hypothetical protein